MGLLRATVYLFLLFNVVSVLSKPQEHLDAAATKVIVQTTVGLVQGEQGGITKNTQKAWYRFRGIPFAEPPVGNLRFQVNYITHYLFY